MASKKRLSSTIRKEKKLKAASMLPGKVRLEGSAKERMKSRNGYKKPSDNPNNSGLYSY